MAKRVLALGLDPVFADFSQMPGLTPELVRNFIDTQLDRARELGYAVQKLLNLVHARAPGARICFNTTPADTAEAIRRWV